MSKKQIRVAIVGVGNCASALVQGVQFYSRENQSLVNSGINFPHIGDYKPSDIQFVAAYDVDARKVGSRLTRAIFAKPNCCFTFNTEFERDFNDPIVELGPELDGVAEHMYEYPKEQAFLPLDRLENMPYWKDKSYSDMIDRFAYELKDKGVDVLLNYLPVGSQKATEFWAEVCLEAKVSLVNCIPVFIASDPVWAKRFKDAEIAIIGDDMRSQFGASIVSAVLQELLLARGHAVDVHYQDNVGGNTDFLNMQDQKRLSSKKISKENVIRAQNEIAGVKTKADSIAAGPAKYFPDLGDNKRAHWLIRGKGFGGSPIEFTADLSVQDSPNSAGVVIDAIRFVKVAQELGIYGPLYGPSAFTQKTPPKDMRPADAREECRKLAFRQIPPLQKKMDEEMVTDIGQKRRVVERMIA